MLYVDSVARTREARVSLRQWLSAAVVSAGSALGAGAADAITPTNPPDKPTVVGFGTLKAATAETAKAKLEAWLRTVGTFDADKFTSTWVQADRPVADRVLDIVLAARPDAAEALAAAADPFAAAPTAVPAVFSDEAVAPFVRGTLAVAYARALGTKRVYEEALEALKGVRPEDVADPAAYYFYKAVAEHALIQREPAATSIARLLDDVSDAPDRYRVVATLMFFDLQSWPKDEKDLANIEKLMDNSGRRLDLARGGPKTQEIQKKIVFRLDEKIKELENQCKGGGGGQCNGGQCPNGGQSPGNGNNLNPQRNAQDSQIMGGAGPGHVDEKKLRKYAEEWGTLPAAERARAVQEITRDLPAKFKPMIEDYFKSLNRINGFGP